MRVLLIVISSMFLSYSATARTSIETRLQRLEKNLGKIEILFEQHESILAKLHSLDLKLTEDNLTKLKTLEHRIEQLHNKIADLNLKLKKQEDFINNVLVLKKQTTTSVPNNTASSEDERQSEQVKFQYCVHLVKNKKLDEALQAFEDFIWQYPSGPFAAQAHFWLAELHLLRWTDDHKNIAARDEAINQFRFVYSRFYEHPKAPDALLKLGLLMYEDSQFTKCKEILNDLITKHPGTSAARIAENKLLEFTRNKN